MADPRIDPSRMTDAEFVDYVTGAAPGRSTSAPSAGQGGDQSPDFIPDVPNGKPVRPPIPLPDFIPDTPQRKGSVSARNTAPDTIDLTPYMGKGAPASPDRIPIPLDEMEEREHKPLDDRPYSTTAIRGALSGTLGMPAGLADTAAYLARRLFAGVTGIPSAEVERRHAEIERGKRDFERRNVGFTLPRPPTGEDLVRDYVEPRFGAYHETGYEPLAQKFAMGAIEGVTSMFGPGAGLRAWKGLNEGEAALRLARQVLGTAGKTAPVGALAGGTGAVATDVTGDPLAGIIGSTVVGGGANAAGRQIGKQVGAYLDPMRPGRRQALADEKLRAAADDPSSVAAGTDAPDQIVSGSRPTLGEASGDIGLLQAQKREQNANPRFAGQILEKEGQQNVARRAALDATAPADADVMSPARLFRQHLAAIDEATQATVDRATADAAAARASHVGSRETVMPPADAMDVVRGAGERVGAVERTAQEGVNRATLAKGAAHRELPPGTPADATGEALRNIVSEADKAKGAMVRKLYEAVDPDGSLRVVTSAPAEAAQSLRKSINPEVEVPSPIAAPVIDMVANLREVTPFADLMKLDKTITAKMVEAGKAGDRIGHSQLSDLKRSVMDAVDNAIENEAKWRQGAVERGTFKREDTLEASLEAYQKTVNDWLAEKHGRGIGARTGTVDAFGTGAVPGGLRAEGKGRGESQGSPRPAGVQSLEPNFDAEAAGRLGAAKEAHKERATTYREGPVGQALKTNGFAGQYRTPDAKIPASAFPKGDIGYHNVGAWLKAAGDNPGAVSTLQEVAVSRLREAMKGGDLTPEVLDAWKREYGPALRALDEAAPNSGFLSKFETAAKATSALEDATALSKEAMKRVQQSAVVPFLGLTNSSEVGNTLLGMVRSKTGPTQLADLMSQMPGTGKAGARDALARAILRNHTSADGGLAADRYRKFLNDNRPALETVFGEDGVNRLLSVSHTALASQAATERVAQAVAARKASIAKAQQSEAAQLAGFTDAQEVRAHVGRLLGVKDGVKDGPTRLAKLVEQTNGNPDALAGLRRAGIDEIMTRLEKVAMAGGDHVLTGRLMPYVDRNAASLRVLYGEAGLANIRRVVADMERSQAAFDAVKVKGGSDTAQSLWERIASNKVVQAAPSFGLIYSMWQAYEHGGWQGAALAAGAAATIKPALGYLQRLRAAGVENVNDLYRLGLLNPEVGRAMIGRAVDARGKPNLEALSRLLMAVERTDQPLRGYDEKLAREARAIGGAVKVDHAAHAARLVSLVDEARRQTTQDTKPLLKLPDAAVSHALAIANKALSVRES